MKKYILLTLALVTSAFLYAQVDFQVSDFKVTLAGTSTLHDWTAEVQTVAGSADLDTADGVLKSLANLHVKLDANSIKSEKGSMMDKNIYKALDTKNHQYITFKLKKVKSLTTTGKTANLLVEGELTIAGTTKIIDLTATGINSAGNYTFEGVKKIKMTDYKVEPPEFMLGAMKTGDEVTINYKVVLANGGLSHK